MGLDYEKLGLKIGLEIHQRLDTCKLFCKCPCLIREDKPDIIVKRKIRASAGETGKVDIAAEMEKKKDLVHIYEAYSDSNCLIELDEEPPTEINNEALNVALQISKILRARVVDKIEVMRKTIANGSVTSGFQRTALVSVDGIMKFDFGEVGAIILLEEESAREIESKLDSVTWRLDRLGIPLIELSTTPDIKTPEQCKEVAAYIGMLLRSTGKAMRGIGSIRQDLNINIQGCDRVELKGAQDLRTIPKVIELEVVRQKNLLELSQKVPKNIKFEKEFVDLTALFKSSDSKVIKMALERDGVVYGVKLPKLKGVLGLEIQPGRRVGSELSDWAKAYGSVGGIFHCDELPKYGINFEDVENIRNVLQCEPEDAFVIVATLVTKAKKALEGVIERAKLLKIGVIKQVRKVNADGTTSFMRLMPGAARMYPETDVKNIVPVLEKIIIPELLSDKIDNFVDKYKLSNDLAELVVKSDKVNLFVEFVEKFEKVKPAFIAETLFGASSAVRKLHGVIVNPTKSDFEILFEHLNSESIAKDSVLDILKQNKPVQEVIENYKLMSDSELKVELENIVKANQGIPFNVLIGKAMAKLRGKASGKKISEFLKEFVSE